MAVIKQGGSNPYAGQVMTTMGYKANRPPLCMACGKRREGQLYTVNANGQVVCADCANPADRVNLVQCGSTGEACRCDEEDGE
jgi:hypothetical protein